MDLLTALGPFGLGLLNMTNPCVLPLYPGFLAYLSGQHQALRNQRLARWLGVIVLAGVLTSMLIIGFVLAALRVATGSVLAYLLPIIYLIVIGMGVLMVFHINPFARLPMLSAPRLRNPLLGSFLYGMLYGPMTLPCAGPLIVGAFVYGTADVGSLVNSIVYIVAFGLGFGFPLVVLPLLAQSIRTALLRWMATHHRVLTRLAGVLLIAIGIGGFLKQWDLIRYYWGF
jgi:cytochrome c-type biogenesis protein